MSREWNKRKAEIMFNESRKIILPKETDAVITQKNKILTLSAVRNLQSYGFTLSNDAINKMAQLPENELIETYKNLAEMCEKAVGADKLTSADVFYPNFPDEVMRMDEVEIYINALIYYTGQGLLGEDWHSHEEPAERMPLIESFERELNIINSATNKDFEDMMKSRMFSVKTLSESQTNELLEYMKEEPMWRTWLVNEKVPNKENLAKICVEGYKTGSLDRDSLKPLLRDTVDVLRFAAVLSNGRQIKDTSISNTANLTGSFAQKKKVYFKLTNKEGKDIKHILNDIPNLYTDLWRRKEEFKALGRVVSMQSPQRLKVAYDNLCHNKKLDEFGKSIESPDFKMNIAVENIEKGNLQPLQITARDYPGIFSRNIVRALNAAQNEEDMIKISEIYSKECSKTPVSEILKLANYIEKSDEMNKRVVHDPNKNKYLIIDKNMPEMSDETKAKIVANIRDTAVSFFKTDTRSDIVYIDPELKYNKIPGNDMRDSSEGTTLTPGSYIPANKECNIKRSFIWWSGHVDIDSSFTFYKSEEDLLNHSGIACSYFNVKLDTKDKTDYVAVHSGDFTDGGSRGGKGVAEYIDLDVEKAKEEGYKYIISDINVYHGNTFDELDVKFGIMQREGALDPEIAGRNRDVFSFNGEIYEPSTVDVSIDISSESKAAIPVIYDVENERFIWVDKALDTRGDKIQNVSGKQFIDESTAVIYKYLHNPNGNMHELFTAYAKGRAVEITDDITKATLVFSSKSVDREESGIREDAKVVTAQEISLIRDEYMSNKEPEVKEEAEKTHERTHSNIMESDIIKDAISKAVDSKARSEKEAKNTYNTNHNNYDVFER